MTGNRTTLGVRGLMIGGIAVLSAGRIWNEMSQKKEGRQIDLRGKIADLVCESYGSYRTVTYDDFLFGTMVTSVGSRPSPESIADQIIQAVVEELSACPMNYSPIMDNMEYRGRVNQKQAMIDYIKRGKE